VLNLMRRQLARNAVFLAIAALMLGGFEILLCAVVASIDVEGAFGQMLQFAPPIVRTMIEQNLMGGSPAGVLAFGWNHPVVHALLTAVAITLAARAIAGEVESGSIELVLAQPLSRARYFAAHVLFGLAALSAVLTTGAAGTAIGQAAFSIPGFGLRLGALFINMLLLQTAIYALTLLASAFGREGGRVALVGVLLAVLSFLVNAIATLWSRAEFAKPYSLHSYFDPRQVLVQDTLSGASLAILAVVTVLATGAAYLRFARRDLPG
jgi:ABC-2 type transport system permease protein